MDIFTKISGLQHISEDVFKLLGQNCLMNCRSTNSSWKNILDQSIFWLNKMKLDGWKALAKHLVDRQLAKIFANNLLDLNQPQWIASMQELENDHQPKEFVLILIKIYNNQAKLLPLEVVWHLMEANKYTDLVYQWLIRIYKIWVDSNRISKTECERLQKFIEHNFDF